MNPKNGLDAVAKRKKSLLLPEVCPRSPTRRSVPIEIEVFWPLIFEDTYDTSSDLRQAVFSYINIGKTNRS
jgi:hypothetical protein